MTWAAALQAAASVMGFCFVGWQIAFLRKNIRGATQDRLYAHYMEVCKLLFQNGHLRPYFYEDERVPELGPNRPKLRAEVDMMSEAICGLIEHCVVQRRNLPPAGWRGCWLPYAQERVGKSSELAQFFEANQVWYTRKMRRAMRKILAKRSPATDGLTAHIHPQQRLGLIT